MKTLKLNYIFPFFIFLSLPSCFADQDFSKVTVAQSQNSIELENVKLVDAIKSSNKDLFLEALSNGANPSYKISPDSNVLSLAAVNLDSFFLQALLENGGDPNIYRASARRSLIFEVLGPDRGEHLKILLKFKPCIDVRDGVDNTPLIYAAILSNYKSMNLLMNNGANTVNENKYGYSVLDVLEDNETRECQPSSCQELQNIKSVISKNK